MSAEPKVNYLSVVPGGDLLDAREIVIIHQCNCVSDRAAGLAKVLFQKFPAADAYKHRQKRSKPGTTFVAVNKGKVIVGLFSQLYPGKAKYKTDSPELRLEWFREGLDSFCAGPKTSVAMPYNIGCGLAGGHWPAYEQVIREWAEKNEINVVLYDLNNEA